MFKKLLPLWLFSVSAGLIGDLIWRVVLHERQSIGWPHPRVSDLSFWWAYLALWVGALFAASSFILLFPLRKALDLRGAVATISLLAATWTMFVVMNISSDALAVLPMKDKRLDAMSTSAEVIGIILLLMTLFVLFRTVDDVQAQRRDSGNRTT